MNNNENENLENKASNINFIDVGIIFAMGLKVFSLVPTIVRISKTKSAEDISYFTPIMLLCAFIILAIICFIYKLILPFSILIVGIITSSILLVQKNMYENSKLANEVAKIDKEVDLSKSKFPFPNPMNKINEPINS